MLRLKAFDNSWGNLDTKFVVLNIKLCFTCSGRTCVKRLQSSKLLWPRLSKNVLFPLCTSNDNSDFWQKCSLSSKKLVLSKTSNMQSWKLAKIKFCSKPKMQNSGYTKPLNWNFNESGTELLLFKIGCFEVMENVKKLKFKGNWAELWPKSFMLR